VNQYPEEPSESGWSFLKVLGVIVGLIGMAGFGFCTLCGIAIGGGLGEFFFLILLGAGMTALSSSLVVAMFRKARQEREEFETRNRRDS
jgi:hypothetical protein